MDIQTMLDNAVQAGRANTMKTSKQLTLGELILKLEAIPKTWKDHEGKDNEKTVRFNFEYLHPTALSSWRGSYREIAIEFSEKGYAPKLSEFISWLKEAIGKTYEGYKGGDFVMGKNTPVWVANYGHSGDTGIVDVRFDEYDVVLLTDKCEL